MKSKPTRLKCPSQIIKRPNSPVLNHPWRRRRDPKPVTQKLDLPIKGA